MPYIQNSKQISEINNKHRNNSIKNGQYTWKDILEIDIPMSFRKVNRCSMALFIREMRHPCTH